ncbi:hypothetical protein F4776DRAFT_626036 [Hypoxylon sp. NC0597]|nr:hypothetical protein F4776DRAFT_626036 [Hypoxylon sp. NC0597]
MTAISTTMPDHTRTSNKNKGTRAVVGATVGATVGAIVGVAGIDPILAAAGFGPGGILVGSLAALVHSLIGNVTAGSLFAFLQSASMGGGAAAVLKAIAAAIGAGVGGLFGWGHEESE